METSFISVSGLVPRLICSSKKKTNVRDALRISPFHFDSAGGAFKAQSMCDLMSADQRFRTPIDGDIRVAQRAPILRLVN